MTLSACFDKRREIPAPEGIGVDRLHPSLQRGKLAGRIAGGDGPCQIRGVIRTAQQPIHPVLDVVGKVPTRVAITGTPCAWASHTFWVAVAER